MYSKCVLQLGWVFHLAKKRISHTRGDGSLWLEVFPVHAGMGPGFNINPIRVTFWGILVVMGEPSGFLIFSHSFCKSGH